MHSIISFSSARPSYFGSYFICLLKMQYVTLRFFLAKWRSSVIQPKWRGPSRHRSQVTIVEATEIKPALLNLAKTSTSPNRFTAGKNESMPMRTATNLFTGKSFHAKNNDLLPQVAFILFQGKRDICNKHIDSPCKIDLNFPCRRRACFPSCWRVRTSRTHLKLSVLQAAVSGERCNINQKRLRQICE